MVKIIKQFRSLFWKDDVLLSTKEYGLVRRYPFLDYIKAHVSEDYVPEIADVWLPERTKISCVV